MSGIEGAQRRVYGGGGHDFIVEAGQGNDVALEGGPGDDYVDANTRHRHSRARRLG
jgi:hypothetical protein